MLKLKIKNKRESLGITLIALVITIIILMILAGISINLILGENGIFKFATKSREDYKNSTEKELADIEKLYSQMLIAANDDAQITLSVQDLNKIIEDKIKKEIEPLNTAIENLNNSIDEEIENIQDIIAVIQNEKRLGTVTIPSTDKHEQQSVDVTFTEPFEDANYCVVVTSIYRGSAWGQSTYTVQDKTANGFKIWCYNGYTSSTNAHPVDWVAIKK